ncbi:hypothetical protein BDN71DRAFT_1438666 [Pleurotus eryngii]|uniref:Uncharacterized protein n=1 Tax=Pleurotus eryngii TaxID=5323 RepID=A0A9P6A9T5_PLEER|nr:hypothetical protein BDN71DRAFT_1438666 [Pleurotus eryngii]
MTEIATPVIVGMVLGIVCLNLAVAAAWFWVRKSRSKMEGQETPSGDLPSRPTHSIGSTLPSPSHSMNDARNPIPSTSLQPFIQPPNMHQIADNTLSMHSFGSILDSYSHPPYKKPPTATLADRKRLSACSASVTLDSSSLYSADSACEEGRDTVPHTCTSLRPKPRVPYPTPRLSWPHQQINGDRREVMSSVGPSASAAPRVKWTAPGRTGCAVPTIESTPSSYVPNSPASASEHWAYSSRSPLQPVSPLRLERKPLFLSRNSAPPSINSSSQRLSLVSSSSEQPLLPDRLGKADATHCEDKTEASRRGTTFAA